MLEEQKDFFNRQIKLKDFGESGQVDLLNSKVLIIGAGGLGHPTAQYLCSMGVGTLTICDHDRVDVSNLHRQVLFQKGDVGSFKASVVKERLTPFGPWTTIYDINQKFDQEIADHLIQNHDLVLDCTDNLETKFLIHDYCFKHSKDLVQASIHKYDGQVQVFNFSKNKDLGCLRCLWENTPIQVSSCDDNGVLGVVPGLFGMIQVNEAVKLLTNNSTWIANEILTIDLKSLETQKFRYKKNNECKLCVNHNETGGFMNDMNLNFNEINVNDYTWLDIRIATAEIELTTKIQAEHIITKTDAEILHEIDNLESSRPFLVICDRGIRSKNLASALRDRGHKNVYSLEGGFMGIEG